MKKVFLALRAPTLLIHLIVFNVHKNRHVTNEDIDSWITRRLNREKPGVKFENRQFTFLWLMTFYPEYRNIFYFRVGILSRLINWICAEISTFKIDRGTPIAGGFVAIHPTSTYIIAKSIGKNFSVIHNTTIGKGTGGTPTIGDNVTLGANVNIAGDISIGDNVDIGMASIITKSIGSGLLVVTECETRILRRDGKKVEGKEYI